MAKKDSKKTIEISDKQPIYLVQAPQKSVLSNVVALLLILVVGCLAYVLVNYRVVLEEKATPSLSFDVQVGHGGAYLMGRPFVVRSRRQPPVVMPKLPTEQVRSPRQLRARKRGRRRMSPNLEALNPPVKEAEIKSVPEPKAEDSHYSCRQAVPRKAKFIQEEYAPYQKKGNAVIAGKVCLTLEDNTEKCFPNARVIINPVTSYSEEWYRRGWAGTEYLEEADPRVNPTNLIRITDAKGAFAFKDLPAGSYYVGAEVCAPKTKDAKDCVYTRLGTRVKMKNFVKPTFKKVYTVR